jgi:hypothetical protein
VGGVSGVVPAGSAWAAGWGTSVVSAGPVRTAEVVPGVLGSRPGGGMPAVGTRVREHVPPRLVADAPHRIRPCALTAADPGDRHGPEDGEPTGDAGTYRPERVPLDGDVDRGRRDGVVLRGGRRRAAEAVGAPSWA